MIEQIIHEELKSFYGSRMESYSPHGVTIKEYNDLVSAIKRIIERANGCKML